MRTPIRDFFGAALLTGRSELAAGRVRPLGGPDWRLSAASDLRSRFLLALTREWFRRLGIRRSLETLIRDHRAELRRSSYLYRVRWRPLACRPFVPRAHACRPNPGHHADLYL